MPLLINWVVNQTLREFGLWVKLLPSFQLSIDVTASDLSRRDCAGALDRAMMRHGVNGTNIEIFTVYMGGPARCPYDGSLVTGAAGSNSLAWEDLDRCAIFQCRGYLC
jgi:hypothetical protein